MGKPEGIDPMTPDLLDSPTPAPSGTQPVNPARGLRPWVFVSFALAGISTVLSALALLFATGILPPLSRSADLETQLHAYLLANPEVIVESVKGMDARRQTAAENELTAVITERHDEIFNDPSSPVGANPKGDVTLVEFFDYNCPYCRRAAPILDGLEQTTKGCGSSLRNIPFLAPAQSSLPAPRSQVRSRASISSSTRP